MRCLWLPGVIIPLAIQQGTKIPQALQLLSGDEQGAIGAAQDVLPDALVLEVLQDVLHLQHGAQTLALGLHPHRLLTLHCLLLGLQQLHTHVNIKEQDQTIAIDI